MVMRRVERCDLVCPVCPESSQEGVHHCKYSIMLLIKWFIGLIFIPPGDMTAEELFNMFFGGGYPGGSVYVRRGGRWEHHGAGRGYTRGHQHNHQAGHAEQSNLSVFLQLMPLLLILLLSLASSLLSSDPTYSLSPTRLIVLLFLYRMFFFGR